MSVDITGQDYVKIYATTSDEWGLLVGFPKTELMFKNVEFKYSNLLLSPGTAGGTLPKLSGGSGRKIPAGKNPPSVWDRKTPLY